jgi:hypothetical protein
MPETMPNFNFAAFSDFSGGVYRVGLAYDVVSIKYRRCLMHGDHHGHTLKRSALPSSRVEQVR